MNGRKEINGYSFKRTIQKGGTPVAVVVIVNIVVAVAKSQGVEIDPAAALTAAVAAYGAIIGLANWIKNKRKGR